MQFAAGQKTSQHTPLNQKIFAWVPLIFKQTKVLHASSHILLISKSERLLHIFHEHVALLKGNMFL